MTPQQRLEIEHACRKVMLKSISTFDDRNFAGFAELFALDGVFVRANQPNEPLVGRAATHRSSRDRAATGG